MPANQDILSKPHSALHLSDQRECFNWEGYLSAYKLVLIGDSNPFSCIQTGICWDFSGQRRKKPSIFWFYAIQQYKKKSFFSWTQKNPCLQLEVLAGNTDSMGWTACLDCSLHCVFLAQSRQLHSCNFPTDVPPSLLSWARQCHHVITMAWYYTMMWNTTPGYKHTTLEEPFQEGNIPRIVLHVKMQALDFSEGRQLLPHAIFFYTELKCGSNFHSEKDMHLGNAYAEQRLGSPLYSCSHAITTRTAISREWPSSYKAS